jgi:DNA helicase-2/ATP-dependent DNA helicase PcrA
MTHTNANEPVFSAKHIAALLAKEGQQALEPTHEQTEVIELGLDAPALVIAGAGSGKTETLANRVVWLIANEQCRPEEVLGLTFTVKAAGELSERIRQQLSRFVENAKRLQRGGPQLSKEQSQAVERVDELLQDGLNMPVVSTYNSFAAQVVGEFGAYASVAQGSTLIDEPTALGLVTEIINASTDPHLAELDLLSDSVAERVLELEHEASEHLVASLTRIHSCCEAFIRHSSRLPYSDSKVDTEKSLGAVTSLVQDLRQKQTVATLAQQYRDEKLRRGFIEFSDQVASAARIVKEFPPARDALSKRHRIVLLDEVQDTSVGQTELLSTLFQGAPVLGVGDPNQTIYAWRGASAEALGEFLDHFSSLEQRELAHELTLSTSWRNPRRILEAANAISQPLRAGTELDVPVLHPKPGAQDGQVTVSYFETEAEEYAALADWFAKSREQLRQEDAHGRYPTAAVLVRTKRQLAPVADALRQRGVPSHTIGLGALLNTPEVTDLVCTLKCVAGYQAENELIRFLTGPRFSVGLQDLAELRSVARWFSERDTKQSRLTDADSRGDEINPDPDRVVTNLDALDLIRVNPDSHVALSRLSETGLQRMRDAATVLHRLRQETHGSTADLVRSCERELHLDLELAAHPRHGDMSGSRGSDDEHRVDPRENIDAFVAEVTQVERNAGSGNLNAVLAWVDRAEEAQDLTEALPEPTRHTVQIMTMHRAKGLEWELVGLPGWREGKFPNDPRSTKGWFSAGNLPDELRGDRASRPTLDWKLASSKTELKARFADYKEQKKHVHFEEETRLAYVAVTRARERLFISGSFWAAQNKPLPPSELFRSVAKTVGQSLPSVAQHQEERPSGETERVIQWPLDALGTRRHAVQNAAHSVEHALGEIDETNSEQVELSRELRLLLAELEHDSVDQPQETTSRATGRINASAFHSVVGDPEQSRLNTLRPVPQRPYRGTDLGNRFHEWVERRFTTVRGTQVALAGMEDLRENVQPGETLATAEGYESADTGSDTSVLPPERDPDESGEPFDASEDQAIFETQSSFEQLKENFEASRWADRQADAVELEISIPFAGQQLICKIDAVFSNESKDGPRFEIVDWKTGKSPRSEAEQRDRMYQLELYRYAYAQWAGIPAAQVDATLFYVADGTELTLEPRHTLAELEELWKLKTAEW